MNVYVVAHTSGGYMFPATKKVFKTEKAVINEYKKLHEQGIRENLSILKAQWVEADFDEYVKAKTRGESSEKSVLFNEENTGNNTSSGINAYRR